MNTRNEQMHFDIFISYKLETANVVREIAQRLTAAGLTVWFAEYEISLDAFSDERVLNARIEEGIAQSQTAVVFSNDRWAESDWCRKEMEWIQKNLRPNQVVEICIPFEARPREEFHHLQQAAKSGRAMTFDGDVERAVQFILTNLAPTHVEAARKTSMVTTALSRPQKFSFGVSIDFEKAGIQVQGVRKPLVTERVFPGVHYHLTSLVMARQVEILIVINPFRSALNAHPLHERANSDDRIVHASYRDYAKTWLEKLQVECRGVHVYFWKQRSHLALSYVADSTSSELPGWHRRYAFVVTSPDGQETGELDITFRVEAASFAEFCGLAVVFDRAAQSADYVPQKALTDCSLRLLFTKVCVLTGAVGEYFLSVSPGTHTPIGASALAMLCAATATDFLCYALSERVRFAAIELATVTGPRDPLWLGLWWLPWVVLNGLGSVLNLAAISLGVLLKISAPWYWALVATWIVAAGTADIILRRFRRLPASVRVASASRNLPSFTALESVAALSPRLIELLGQCQEVHVLWNRHFLKYVQFATLLPATLAVSFGSAGLLSGGIIAGLLLLAASSYQLRWKSSPQTQSAISSYRESETNEAATLAADAFLSEAGENTRKVANAVVWYARACEKRTGSFPMVRNLAASLVRLVELQIKSDRLIWDADEDDLLNQVTKHVVEHSEKLAVTRSEIESQASLRGSSNAAGEALRRFHSQHQHISRM